MIAALSGPFEGWAVALFQLGALALIAFLVTQAVRTEISEREDMHDQRARIIAADKAIKEQQK